jgi:hypothetical protein
MLHGRLAMVAFVADAGGELSNGKCFVEQFQYDPLGIAFVVGPDKYWSTHRSTHLPTLVFEFNVARLMFRTRDASACMQRHLQASTAPPRALRFEHVLPGPISWPPWWSQGPW